MEHPNLDILKQFDISNLPDLDVAVLGALELFSGTSLPEFDYSQFKRPLVAGSEGAAVTARILFDGSDAVFVNESDYEEKLEEISAVDGAVLVSASGGKHAIKIAKALTGKGIETWLLTNNEKAPAQEFIPKEKTILFPKNREPYTYNTSTYLGMIFSKTKEDPEELHTFIEKQVKPIIPDNLQTFDSFYLIIPEHFYLANALFTTKFDELLEPKVSGRAFTFEQTEHAKTVVSSNTQLFISFGKEQSAFGTKETQVFIPLPQDAGYSAMIAIAYYVIGHIQKQFPPYFKENIVEYTEKASRLFNQTISPIVE